MRVNTSADKSREELWRWQQTDPSGLVDYTFQLQTEVRRLRDRAAQNSRNSSRPPATDRVEQPKPKSLRKRSGRKPGGNPVTPAARSKVATRPHRLISAAAWLLSRLDSPLDRAASQALCGGSDECPEHRMTTPSTRSSLVKVCAKITSDFGGSATGSALHTTDGFRPSGSHSTPDSTKAAPFSSQAL